MQPNFDDVIEILKKAGVADNDIATFVENLTSYLAQQLYVLMVEQLSEEDMQRLNALTNDGEREKQMQELFTQKTGENLKDLSDEFVKTYTQEFLAGYKLPQIPH